MVLNADSAGWEGLAVGDRVLVTGSRSPYLGHYGTVVAGKRGGGFSPSGKSMYVQFEIDGVLFRKSIPPEARVRTLRCGSLVHAPLCNTVDSPDLSERCVVAAPSSRDRLRQLCDDLEALALSADRAGEALIVTFAAGILSDGSP